MLMELILYNNLSDENVLRKNITEVQRMEGELQVSTSVSSPTIWVGNDVTQLQVNYAYLPDLKRYYFIQEVRLVRSGIYSLFLLCDTLMTFQAEILQSKAHITVQSDMFDPYATDYNTEDRKTYRSVEWDYEFPEKSTMVLVAAQCQSTSEMVRPNFPALARLRQG